MIGVIVVFAISWLLLWLIEREHITVLGILPNGKRLKAFFVGMVVMAVFCLINLLGQAYFKEFNYVRNVDYDFKESLNGIWWTFKAAFFEELIFRGALLYLLIKRLGIKWACIISAIGFGVYHWFSYQMFGRGLVPMAYVFILTGASGWMFAYTFAKTKSILVPLGLHFGWIVISIVVLSAGPLGDSLYVADSKGVDLNGWEQLLFFLWQALIVPGVITWYIFKNYKRREV